ncbi:MAG: putative nitroreductase [Ramlibacter sp.]|jgi:hypothetical protein|nr:putative nitroreductase [Ramlibacter sp.]
MHRATEGAITLPLPRPEVPRPEAGDRSAGGPPASLSLDQVSSLLWAGFGLNRHGSGGRAPFADPRFPPVAVYALLAEGAYRYDVREHRLLMLTPGDIRTRRRAAGAVPAALVLVYVEDGRCAEDPGTEECGVLSGIGAVSIADGVAAYCTSAGLEATAEQHADPHLATSLRLVPGERIAFVQGVRRAAPAAH